VGRTWLEPWRATGDARRGAPIQREIRVKRLKVVAAAARELDEMGVLREAERALASLQGTPRGPNGRGAEDPLAALPRLLRDSRAKNVRACVRHLAANPRASNRQIAKALGGKAENQICTMLRRMQQEGLLNKHTGGPGKPNAWTLSPTGETAARILAQIEGI
jgi:hypothetical protein